MNSYWIAALVPWLAQLVLFARWLHRRLRDDEIARAFVRDMATNHLPHLYDALRLIGSRLGVEIPAPPPIRFLDLDEQGSAAPERRRGLG